MFNQLIPLWAKSSAEVSSLWIVIKSASQSQFALFQSCSSISKAKGVIFYYFYWRIRDLLSLSMTLVWTKQENKSSWWVQKFPCFCQKSLCLYMQIVQLRVIGWRALEWVCKSVCEWVSVCVCVCVCVSILIFVISRVCDVCLVCIFSLVDLMCVVKCCFLCSVEMVFKMKRFCSSLSQI